MYETASAVAAVEPQYGGHDSEAQGLYDEPAFKAQADKENPLYESTEDLLDKKGVSLAISLVHAD